MDLNSILSQLGIGSKETVCLSVTPGVGLELMQLDVSAKTIKNYAYRPLEYNESLREITDINAFKDAVTELFEELKINIKSNVILNIPMVLLGNKDLPLLLGDDAVTEALTSEVEQSYIFKRYEPVVSWIDASNGQTGETRKLFYSAVQKNVIEDIKTALNELGATLVGLETSLISLIKSLAFAGYIDEQMKEGVTWNLMIISQTGYSICSMIGKNLVEYYEEPLAIKSFDGDEIYNAISASAQIALMSYPANYLCIVSETDMVSAEILAARLPVDGTVSFIENNQFKKHDVLPVSLEVLEETAHMISLEAIGVAVGNNVTLPLRFNFLGGAAGATGDDNPDELVHVVLGSYEFDISPNMAKMYSMIIAGVLLIPALILTLAIPAVVKQKQGQLDELNASVKRVQDEIKKFEAEQNKYQDFDVNNEIKKVLSDNRSKLMAYIALGESVPKKLWLTYFTARDDGKFDIKGESSNVEDVYTFYRNMKDSLINTQLKLHKLVLKDDSIDEDVLNSSSDYEFEITNMDDSELNPSEESEVKPEDQANAPEGNKKDDNKGKLLNKPLMNPIEEQ